VLLGAGRLDEAAAMADAGLRLERPRDSFFLANLWSVRGQIHEARAALLSGDTAENELRAALAAYDRGREMNERIQIRLVKESRP
jgi:hypothetical protein